MECSKATGPTEPAPRRILVNSTSFTEHAATTPCSMASTKIALSIEYEQPLVPPGKYCAQSWKHCSLAVMCPPTRHVPIVPS